MRADPALADDLVWAGFDMISRANNHTGDYGTLGQELTTDYVADAGIVQAGVGLRLTDAREAKFLETAKARVALISVSSSFAKHMAASRSRDDVPARPGRYADGLCLRTSNSPGKLLATCSSCRNRMARKSISAAALALSS